MTFKEYLETKNITLKEASISLGMPYEYVRRYANGSIIPNKENMQKITAYTNNEVQPNDFYGVNDEN